MLLYFLRVFDPPTRAPHLEEENTGGRHLIQLGSPNAEPAYALLMLMSMRVCTLWMTVESRLLLGNDDANLSSSHHAKEEKMDRTQRGGKNKEGGDDGNERDHVAPSHRCETAHTVGMVVPKQLHLQHLITSVQKRRDCDPH